MNNDNVLISYEIDEERKIFKLLVTSEVAMSLQDVLNGLKLAISKLTLENTQTRH